MIRNILAWINIFSRSYNNDNNYDNDNNHANYDKEMIMIILMKLIGDNKNTNNKNYENSNYDNDYN